MSEFFTFLQFGIHHIMDVDAMDHILFLVALAAIYRFRDARNVFWVVTAFTVGHSVTLALAVTGALTLPTALIEFLIPVTIVLTGLANLFVMPRTKQVPPSGRDDKDVILSPSTSLRVNFAKDLHLLSRHHRPILAGVFGLIHGAGFANYLNALFVGDIAAPLFGFNVGIEIGQVAVLLAIAALFAITDRIITALRFSSERWPALRLRVVGVSLLVVTLGSAWAVERSPW